MFQAISLESDADAAKRLAFSALSLIAGVKRVDKADLELTAIVGPIRQAEGDEPSKDRIAQYRFGVEIMEEHTIRVYLIRSAAHRGDSPQGLSRLGRFNNYCGPTKGR